MEEKQKRRYDSSKHHRAAFNEVSTACEKKRTICLGGAGAAGGLNLPPATWRKS